MKKQSRACCKQDQIVRLFNAIKDAVNEMERCRDDSIQDIWNEMLERWETGLRMDHNHNIEYNTEISGQRAAKGTHDRA